MNIIRTVQQLKETIDFAWRGISVSCKNCTDPDCVGYVWVLPEEEDLLLNANVQLVQINGKNGPIFIDSYNRDKNGCIVVSQSKPNCPYLCTNGMCSIHERRPLACHLYPLGPDINENGKLIWALHTDCRYVRDLEFKNELLKKIDELKQVLDQISPELRKDLLQYWEQVEYISIRPDGPNQFIELMEI